MRLNLFQLHYDEFRVKVTRILYSVTTERIQRMEVLNFSHSFPLHTLTKGPDFLVLKRLDFLEFLLAASDLERGRNWDKTTTGFLVSTTPIIFHSPDRKSRRWTSWSWPPTPCQRLHLVHPPGLLHWSWRSCSPSRAWTCEDDCRCWKSVGWQKQALWNKTRRGCLTLQKWMHGCTLVHT